MTLNMEGQMVRSRECPLTHLASIGSDTSVLPHVSSKFIRSGKLPTTSLPGTHIGLLSCVGSQMCLHMRGFVVGLLAVVIGTVMDLWHFLNTTNFSHFDREL